ncbi:MAG: hypothetical protein ACXWWC_15525 [Chitinophagaceae bacterium]
MEELAARHFSSLNLFKLEINPMKFVSTWIMEKKPAILVCGSYGRSGISQFFNKSFVKQVIADPGYRFSSLTNSFSFKVTNGPFYLTTINIPANERHAKMIEPSIALKKISTNIYYHEKNHRCI